MSAPAPDALLIAQHVKEWPYESKDDAFDDQTETVYLYWVDNDERHRAELASMGLLPPAGVGRRADKAPKDVIVFGKADTVRCRLVFKMDESDESDVQHLLGRDVEYEEWVEARDWLEEHNVHTSP